MCSIHRGMFSTSGDIISTLGDVKYIGGISLVHQAMFNTLWDIIMHVGGGGEGYHEYIGGCSVHWGFQYKFKGFYHVAQAHAS